MSSVNLIVGLGNPGSNYEKTRHNAGALFVQELSKKLNINLVFSKKHSGFIGNYKTNNRNLILLIPTTFMNKSGSSVASIANFYKFNPESILVIHDELDLPNATIRLKESGGHGGHNGIRSVIDHLNGDNSFKRLRVGIGHPGKGKDIIAYVLKKAPSEQRKELFNSMKDSLEIGEKIMIDGWQKTVMYYHSGDEEELDES